MRTTIAGGDGILNPPKALFLRAKGCAWNQQALGTEVVRRHARPPPATGAYTTSARTNPRPQAAPLPPGSHSKPDGPRTPTDEVAPAQSEEVAGDEARTPAVSAPAPGTAGGGPDGVPHPCQHRQRPGTGPPWTPLPERGFRGRPRALAPGRATHLAAPPLRVPALGSRAQPPAVLAVGTPCRARPPTRAPLLLLRPRTRAT